MRGFLLPQPSGDAGIFATIGHLKNLARAAALRPEVRSYAAELVRGIDGFDTYTQSRVLADFVGIHCDFLADPYHAEALHDPVWTLGQILTRQYVQVDCDDVASLAAALGLAIGLRARFVVVGFGSSPSVPFRHIWTELAGPRSRQWVPVDPTRPPSSPPIGRVVVVDA